MNAVVHCHCKDQRTVLSTELLLKEQLKMKEAAHLLLLVQVEAHLTQALPDGPMVEPAVSSDQVTVNEANSNKSKYGLRSREICFADVVCQERNHNAI